MTSNTVTEIVVLTPAELEQMHRYIEETGEAVVEATKGLSEAQWRFQESPERWSIAGILEHIVVVQEIVLGPVRERLAAAAPVSAERDYRQVEDVIYQMFPVRMKQIQAPDPSHPTGRWTPEEALERLKANCGRLRAYVESTPDVRLRAIESAPLKAVTNGELDQMDGYQWVVAVGAHTKRHTGQIIQVKADHRFPA